MLVDLSEAQLSKLEKSAKKGEEITVLAELDDVIGHSWLIRTVTYFSVGRITKIVGPFFLMEESSWVADTGRFMNCIKEGKLNEVEPVGPMMVNISSIIDMFPWSHALPTDQK